jgi:hypothetical protein
MLSHQWLWPLPPLPIHFPQVQTADLVPEKIAESPHKAVTHTTDTSCIQTFSFLPGRKNPGLFISEIVRNGPHISI